MGVALGVAMPLDAAEWEITQVTDFDGSDGRRLSAGGVGVSDAYVVWGETEFAEWGDLELGMRLYDGNTIRTLSSLGSAPTVSGQNVFWGAGSIMHYDGESVRAVAAALGSVGSIDASGPYIAWMEQFDRMVGVNPMVHLTDWTQGSDRTFGELVPGNRKQSEPAVNSSHMIWRELDGIHLYDIQSDSEQLLPDTEAARHPDLSDTHIVWQQGRSLQHPPGYEIFLYEIESGTKTQLTDNDRQDDRPVISGSNVAWWQYDGHDLEIFFYDGNSTRQVTDNEFHDPARAEWTPAISGSYVTWEGYDGNDSEIFVYDGDSVIQLTDNDYNDVRPAIDGSRIAWVGYVDEDIEVFLATRVPEPSVIALLITGAIVLLLRRGKRLLRRAMPAVGCCSPVE